MKFLSDHVGSVMATVVFVIMLLGMFAEHFSKEEAGARAEKAQADLQALRIFIFRIFDNLVNEDQVRLLKNFEDEDNHRLIWDTDEVIFTALSGLDFFRKASKETLEQLLEISKNISSNQAPTRLRLYLTEQYLKALVSEAVICPSFERCMGLYDTATGLSVKLETRQRYFKDILYPACDLAKSYSEIDTALLQAHKLENGSDLVQILHHKMSDLLKKEGLAPAH